MQRMAIRFLKYTFLNICCLALFVACEQRRVAYDADGDKYQEVYSRWTGITERTEYYPDGKIKIIGYFEDGKRHGEFVQFDDNRNLIAKAIYANDVLDGLYKEYYPNGKLKTETHYYNGKLSGWDKEYYLNGQLKSEVFYSNDEPRGWSYEYHPNGKKRYVREFIVFNGDTRLNQFLTYDVAGTVINDSSHYITITSRSDTINLGDELTVYFEIKGPFYKEKTQVQVLIGGFDEQYRHVDPSKTDTIAGTGLSAKYTFQASERGKQFIRGRLDDYKIEYFDEGDIPWEKREVNIYFKKEFYVK